MTGSWGATRLRSRPQLADLAGLRAGQRAFDVSVRGPGALTTELVVRLGADAVAAADPSEPFVEAARARHPGVEVALAGAEDLPFDDGAFDAALAQLVVSFMSDRRPGSPRCGGSRGPAGRRGLRWDPPGASAAVAVLARGAGGRPRGQRGCRAGGGERGAARGLFESAGLEDVEDDALWVRVDHARFEEWWDPFTLGVGP